MSVALGVSLGANALLQAVHPATSSSVASLSGSGHSYPGWFSYEQGFTPLPSLAHLDGETASTFPSKIRGQTCLTIIGEPRSI